MPNGENKIRDLFEKHHLGGNQHTAARRNEHGDYVLPSIQDAWAGFQSAFEILNMSEGRVQRLWQEAGGVFHNHIATIAKDRLPLFVESLKND